MPLFGSIADGPEVPIIVSIGYMESSCFAEERGAWAVGPTDTPPSVTAKMRIYMKSKAWPPTKSSFVMADVLMTYQKWFLTNPDRAYPSQPIFKSLCEKKSEKDSKRFPGTFLDRQSMPNLCPILNECLLHQFRAHLKPDWPIVDGAFDNSLLSAVQVYTERRLSRKLELRKSGVRSCESFGKGFRINVIDPWLGFDLILESPYALT